jgi:hypothetical protein
MIDQNVLKVFNTIEIKRMTAVQIEWLSQYVSGLIFTSMENQVYLAWLCMTVCDGYQVGRDALHKAILASRTARQGGRREYEPDTTDMMYGVVSFRQRTFEYDDWSDFASGNERLLKASCVFDFLKAGWGI